MNTVHPSAVIDPDVVLGDGNTIGACAVILGPTTIGDDNWIGPHVILGTPGEIRGIDHGRDPAVGGVGTGLHIGSRNVIREYTTIHQGHYARTTVGDDCYLMNKVYIGHDNTIADRVTMASSATLGGHISVGAGANLGMNCVVHQRRRIGPLAMVGMGSVVTHDIPPAALAYGNPCRVHGANRVGMTRAGIAEDLAAGYHAAYQGGTVDPRAIAGADAAPALADLWDWWDERGA